VGFASIIKFCIFAFQLTIFAKKQNIKTST